MNGARQAFLEALAIARPILAADEVAGHWNEPSTLPEMRVSALAGHLLRAPTTVIAYLEQPPPVEAPISPGEYFATILTTSDISDPLHVAIRSRAEKESAEGHDALVSRWDAARADIAVALASEPDDRVLAVIGELVMRLDDYLVTRLVEVVVHTDDLATSVGLDSPLFAAGAMKLVFDQLVEVARIRHGDLAVLRGFSRRERDAVNALRIF